MLGTGGTRLRGRDPLPPSVDPIDREIDRMHERERADDEAFDVLTNDLEPPKQ